MERRTTGMKTQENSEFNALIPGKCSSFFPTVTKYHICLLVKKQCSLAAFWMGGVFWKYTWRIYKYIIIYINKEAISLCVIRCKDIKKTLRETLTKTCVRGAVCDSAVWQTEISYGCQLRWKGASRREDHSYRCWERKFWVVKRFLRGSRWKLC